MTCLFKQVIQMLLILSKKKIKRGFDVCATYETSLYCMCKSENGYAKMASPSSPLHDNLFVFEETHTYLTDL